MPIYTGDKLFCASISVMRESEQVFVFIGFSHNMQILTYYRRRGPQYTED